MAWSDIPTIVKSILYRFWGDQTSEQAKIQRASEQAKIDLYAALHAGDLSRADAAVERLRSLRDKAAAIAKRD